MPKDRGGNDGGEGLDAPLNLGMRRNGGSRTGGGSGRRASSGSLSASGKSSFNARNGSSRGNGTARRNSSDYDYDDGENWQEYDNPPESKRSRRRSEKGSAKPFFVMLFVAALIAAIAWISVYLLGYFGVEIPLLHTGKVGEFEKALNEYNYQAAYYVYTNTTTKTDEGDKLIAHLNGYFDLCLSGEYNSDTYTKYRGLNIFEDEIKQTLFDKMYETVKKVYSGEYTTENGKLYVSRLGKFDFAEDTLNECVEEIGLKDKSDAAYKSGTDAYYAGEFEEAVRQFRLVSEMDTAKYAVAQDGISKCMDYYGKDKLDEAQRLIDAGNTKEATTVLKALIELFGEYPEAQSILDTVQ